MFLLQKDKDNTVTMVGGGGGKKHIFVFNSGSSRISSIFAQ